MWSALQQTNMKTNGVRKITNNTFKKCGLVGRTDGTNVDRMILNLQHICFEPSIVTAINNDKYDGA